MDFHRKSVVHLFILQILSILWMYCQAGISKMGHLNAGQKVSLIFNSTNANDCLEYTFATNYKKVYFDLITTPTTDQKYRQRIILSDLPFAKCPLKCTEEPNYCTAISNRIFSQTQAMFSKWFPILYIYIVNKPDTSIGYLELPDENTEIEKIGDSNLEVYKSRITTAAAEGVPESSSTTPMFTLTPNHLDRGWKIITMDFLPQCASLGVSQCINPAFCTTDCSLLTCQTESGENVFSLCTGTNSTAEEMDLICQSHSKYGGVNKVAKCTNPILYKPSLSETSVSILLLAWALMAMFACCIFCYNIRLLKTGEIPCDLCTFCPEWLFPRKIEDNPLYKEEIGNESFGQYDF